MEGSQAGDSLVFFYSDHGSRERDKDHDEADGATDYETAGKIYSSSVNFFFFFGYYILLSAVGCGVRELNILLILLNEP